MYTCSGIITLGLSFLSKYCTVIGFLSVYCSIDSRFQSGGFVVVFKSPLCTIWLKKNIKETMFSQGLFLFLCKLVIFLFTPSFNGRWLCTRNGLKESQRV